ncbi:N-terminal acetyltransferase B complex catalytic subunit NAA20 isoform X2 [Herrania umbratica]|uniref:N-terminal acetyltransferase B complex catalytic subunit NAA20 isoform X2 n=1 Tax=Herrania umbratica TaxID=108875 RepID=A0A6J0ZZG7_9ROSI|nr:N-terminal acetyltransferase B complex catalytic subunit NAA20 isoform X2 [Herrania umbratica]
MTTIRRFCCNDLLRFASVNLDHLTETFNMSFYMTYLARWPDYFHVAEGPGKRIMGYIMGKVEGQGESWHGHVTAVTVAPEYRRQQLAKKLMNLLEDISDKIDKAYFVDLFVRASNTPAIKMYEKMVAKRKWLGCQFGRELLTSYKSAADGQFYLENSFFCHQIILTVLNWIEGI